MNYRLLRTNFTDTDFRLTFIIKKVVVTKNLLLLQLLFFYLILFMKTDDFMEALFYNGGEATKKGAGKHDGALFYSPRRNGD